MAVNELYHSVTAESACHNFSDFGYRLVMSLHTSDITRLLTRLAFGRLEERGAKGRQELNIH
jgi:hypothetical protein